MSEIALDFGAVLRSWRQHRRMSQLQLSSHSGISQRHISFLETGRSQPSRAMVIALSESLDVPLRERNALLQSAGFRAAYAEQGLDDQAIGIFKDALQATLDHHEPYPAMVLDGRWNMAMANQAALNFFSLFVDPFEALARMGNPTEFQVVRLCMSDLGLKPYIRNWHELVVTFLQRARKALIVNPNDPLMPVLIQEILEHPDAEEHWRQPTWTAPPAPVVSMLMEKDGEQFALFTMLAHFGAAQHVTIEELSVETFYPADATTKRLLTELANA